MATEENAATRGGSEALVRAAVSSQMCHFYRMCPNVLERSENLAIRSFITNFGMKAPLNPPDLGSPPSALSKNPALGRFAATPK